jgi:hypothetical protein
MAGLDIEHGGADLRVDGDGEVLLALMQCVDLRADGLFLAALRGLAEDGELQRSLGDEVSVIASGGLADDAVEAVEGERGQPLVSLARSRSMLSRSL